MSIYEAVIDLIGQPPSGFEPVVWCVSAVVLIFLVRTAFSVVASVLDWIGGRR